MDKRFFVLSEINIHVWSPINNIALVLFRIVFGLVMAGEMTRWVMTGELAQIFISNRFSFPFISFQWLSFVYGSPIYWLSALVILAGIFVSLGFYYRISSAILTVLWTIFYWSNKIHYNNHFYLMLLLCWIMLFMPAHRRLSLDVFFKRTERTTQCYTCQIWLFIFQVAVMYFFAAVAKMNTDWLQAIPVAKWLSIKKNLPVIGKMLSLPIMPWIIAYGGLFFDLFIVPGLLFKSTRIYFFLLAVFFHLFNSYVFGIGSFPYLALGLSLFFFEPKSLEQLLRLKPELRMDDKPVSAEARYLITGVLIVYIVLQVLLPVRHLFISGNVSWTEEGHRMSWRMMTRAKSGKSYFKIRDKNTGLVWYEQPDKYFDQHQLREIAVLPDITWQAARYICNEYRQQNREVAVYAINKVSLNYREAHLLIDTNVNLAGIEWQYTSAKTWIKPY